MAQRWAELAGTYLKESISTLQPCRTERSNWAEGTPEMNTGEQGTWGQQDGSLQNTQRQSVVWKLRLGVMHCICKSGHSHPAPPAAEGWIPF